MWERKTRSESAGRAVLVGMGRCVGVLVVVFVGVRVVADVMVGVFVAVGVFSIICP